ncbi:MAG: 3-phosphoserine/phosphohydroxythreonine transaminase [Defluviitaleaceae bacterium]|nr:3-phosphoserine/phosphohydroxythreonine transaminase [Defluviitaleaceae bacterium]
MQRVYNFSAGPSMLPLEVLEKAQSELLNYNNTGMSVMEMSHRSKPYEEIIATAEALLREIMSIPENYKVLFLQGGASTQFAMIPFNLTKNKKADYVNTGNWSSVAIKEGKRFTDLKVVASSEDKTFSYIPTIDKGELRADADYFHYTVNNTIYGTRFTEYPETGNVPLVCDASSSVLSEVYDMSKFGIFYAGAQKNIGPAGVTVVIIREDLIGNALPDTPTMLNYETHAKAGSMHNTPPTYGIYLAKLVFEWVKAQGGVAAIQKLNEAKAKLVYDAIDESQLFTAHVPNLKDRSLMNIPFFATNEDLDAKFIKECASLGLTTLKGYRTVGGMRASMYNGMPMEGAKALADHIKKFDMENK